MTKKTDKFDIRSVQVIQPSIRPSGNIEAYKKQHQFYCQGMIIEGFKSRTKELHNGRKVSPKRWIDAILATYLPMLPYTGHENCERRKRGRNAPYGLGAQYPAIVRQKYVEKMTDWAEKLSVKISDIFAAAVLTYFSMLNNRPTLFCPVCSLPVDDTKFLYSVPKLNATAFILTDDKSGYQIYHQYGDDEMFSLIGYVQTMYDEEIASDIANVLSEKAPDNVRLLETLEKHGFKPNKLWGSGLVGLKGKSYIACKSYRKVELI